jgi:hypothetical protein
MTRRLLQRAVEAVRGGAINKRHVAHRCHKQTIADSYEGAGVANLEGLFANSRRIPHPAKRWRRRRDVNSKPIQGRARPGKPRRGRSSDARRRFCSVVAVAMRFHRSPQSEP